MNLATALALPTPADPAGEKERLYEIINGQRVELPPLGTLQNKLATEIAFFLTRLTRRRLGHTIQENLFVLDAEANLQRRPDVAFVSYERWPRQQPVPDTNAWAVVPNLAVEVVSPTNTANEIVTRVDEYFRAGVQLVWIVYPVVAQVYVYTSRSAISVVERAGQLEGGSVLPGFQLPLAELFEQGESAQVEGS
jgi:Uma2 family endonuclease